MDDDEEVRTRACRGLWSQDYVVLEAATPDAALAICEQRKGPIDLLLTDVIGKHGVLVYGAFVQKPFTPSGLVEKVREVFRT